MPFSSSRHDHTGVNAACIPPLRCAGLATIGLPIVLVLDGRGLLNAVCEAGGKVQREVATDLPV
jgi:hypothetical protein